MNLNFELNLYVAKLLIIVWLGIPYLTIKYIEYFHVDNILKYFLSYILQLIVLPLLVLPPLVLLQLICQAICQIFNTLLLIW